MDTIDKIVKENSWFQNVEYIFTEEQLSKFCREKILQKIKDKGGNYHYVKAGCKVDGLKYFNNLVKTYKKED